MSDVNVVGAQGVVCFAFFDCYDCLCRGDFDFGRGEFADCFCDFPVCFVRFACLSGGEMFVKRIGDVFVCMVGFVEVYCSV